VTDEQSWDAIGRLVRDANRDFAPVLDVDALRRRPVGARASTRARGQGPRRPFRAGARRAVVGLAAAAALVGGLLAVRTGRGREAGPDVPAPVATDPPVVAGTAAPPAGSAPVTASPAVVPVVPVPARATIAVVDGDFEARPVSEGAHGFAPLGWTVSGGTLQVLVFNPSAPWYATLGPGRPTTGTMDGPDVVAFAGDARGSIEQTASVAGVASGRYELRVAVGGRDTTDVFAGATVELVIGSEAVAASVVDAPPAPGTFADVVVTHDARPDEAGKPIAVRITAKGGAGPTGYLDVDNVRLRLLPV